MLKNQSLNLESLVSNNSNGETKQYYKTTCKQCVNSPRVRKDNVDPKVCNKCGVSKPLSEYAYEPSRDRYRGECKQCKYEQRMKSRAENPEIVARERERNRWRYNNVEGVRERAREVANKSRAKHKDRRNAELRERYANDSEYAEKQRQYQEIFGKIIQSIARSQRNIIKFTEKKIKKNFVSNKNNIS